MATKTVFATLMGRPNVGKSTLLNRMIGEKVSIVSPKPQTTRTRITGILTKGEVQYVFMDMPGFITGKSGLGKRMEQTVSDTVEESEIALFVTEAKAPNEAEKRMLERLKGMGIPAFLIINKVDAIPKEKILSAITAFTALYDFEAVIPLSARSGDGVVQLFQLQHQDECHADGQGQHHGKYDLAGGNILQIHESEVVDHPQEKGKTHPGRSPLTPGAHGSQVTGHGFAQFQFHRKHLRFDYYTPSFPK